MASQKDSQNDQTNSKNASSRGTPGNAQAARSEEQLDQDERSLIGDTAEDRNLTGSTTYVTLPDQKGDQSQSGNGSQSSGGRSSSNQESGRGESYGSSHGDTTR